VGKAAIEALTRYLAVELGPAGIRVNTVSAGPIDTDALRQFSTYGQMKDASIRLSPGRRMGEPADVAEVVAFLCGDGARWIYGQTLIVDGGLSLLSAH
jgi:NAD(P)-dependent dehydrogenase (short-subunit alcohol dehydrogenase family)